MEVQKGNGGCFWLFMALMALVGLITFPYGVAVWLIQAIIIIRIARS